MFNPWILAMRPKTLVAAIMPVMLGSAFAWHDGAFSLFPALVCLIFALLIQIGTNYANDYYDGIRGADTEERLGPTRAVAKGLITSRAMRKATGYVLATAFAVGLILIHYGGWWLLPIGIGSVLFAIAYTGGPYPLGYHGLGDVFVILFFGLVAAPMTYFVQAQTFTGGLFLSGLGMGLVINNLLVVNNYRDIAEDQASGKRTLIVRFGRRFGRALYTGSYLIALCIPLLLVLLGEIHFWAAIIVPFGMTILAALNMLQLREASSAADFDRLLGHTAKSIVFYGILFSVALLIG